MAFQPPFHLLLFLMHLMPFDRQLAPAQGGNQDGLQGANGLDNLRRIH